MCSSGTLYLVGTPIGNLEDISIRALRVLKEVDLIAAEDTRTTKKLLAKYGIKNRLVSYYQGQEESKIGQLLERMKRGGEIALVSEAGMPGLSDPGYRLVNKAIKAGIRIVPIPGPSAAVTAAVVSGLRIDRFVFEGFLPAKKTTRRKRLFLLQAEERTIICYESPRRLLGTLRELDQVMGERKVVVARELTKRYEEIVRGKISEVINHFDKKEVKGEIVLLVEGKKDKASGNVISIPEQIEDTEKRLGISRMEAIKLVAQLRGLAKNMVYKEYQAKSRNRKGEKDEQNKRNQSA